MQVKLFVQMAVVKTLSNTVYSQLIAPQKNLINALDPLVLVLSQEMNAHFLHPKVVEASSHSAPMEIAAPNV